MDASPGNPHPFLAAGPCMIPDPTPSIPLVLPGQHILIYSRLLGRPVSDIGTLEVPSRTNHQLPQTR
ncbi:hypothetical protein M405DRAFT_349172 [Rhizopogon salebrosus TDB-379]|nr:hypothetical protein M405DRAFT_349172 [Rhizopogon salebrosus TDB-379]